MNLTTLKSWWENLQERERQVLSIGGTVLGILFIYLAIWSPLSSAVADQKHQVTAQTDLLNYLQQASTHIQALKASGIQVVAGENADLLTLAEQSLSAGGLTAFLKQVQQPQDDQVSLTFEKAPFDKLMQWTQTLAMLHGVSVVSLSATRLSVTGTADVKMVLSTAH
ncbi:MAG: type II secretion system protein M [Gammaproteobacteria bacterium]|nr:type II secretion system protein M [Gammaproteobacteria bacterium]